MNDTITLSQLITRLAAVSGVDNNTARKFLRALFATVEDNVAAGHTITIKGIGTFRPVSDDLSSGNTTVAFTPDKDLAAELNRPFEVFTAVELADGVIFDEPAQETPEEENHEYDEVPEFITEPAEETVAQQESEPRQEQKPQPLRWPEEEDEEPVVTTEVSTPTEPEEPEQVIAVHEVEQPRRNLLWLWIGLIFLAVIAGAYLAAVYTTPVTPRQQTEEEEVPEAADLQIEEVSVEEIAPAQQDNQTAVAAATPTPTETPQVTAPPIQEEKKPVYDTVDVSLIRLAKKHYGESSYWVFIYEANSDKIPNPNRIRPGQKVLIPDQSTFPGSTKAETVKIAKAKQTELLQRFK